MLPDIVYDLLLFASAIVAGLFVKWLFSVLSKRNKTRQSGQFSMLASILNRLLVPLLRLGNAYKDPIDKTVRHLQTDQFKGKEDPHTAPVYP